jgi:hypothetical protein
VGEHPRRGRYGYEGERPAAGTQRAHDESRSDRGEYRDRDARLPGWVVAGIAPRRDPIEGQHGLVQGCAYEHRDDADSSPVAPHGA